MYRRSEKKKKERRATPRLSCTTRAMNGADDRRKEHSTYSRQKDPRGHGLRTRPVGQVEQQKRGKTTTAEYRSTHQIHKGSANNDNRCEDNDGAEGGMCWGCRTASIHRRHTLGAGSCKCHRLMNCVIGRALAVTAEEGPCVVLVKGTTQCHKQADFRLPVARIMLLLRFMLHEGRLHADVHSRGKRLRRRGRPGLRR